MLRKYGYCLSKSIAADMVTAWFSETHAKLGGSALLAEINEVLEKNGSAAAYDKDHRTLIHSAKSKFISDNKNRKAVK